MADTDNIGAKLFSDLKRDYGLTDEQAAGVVGNFMHESAGFNTLQEIGQTSGRGGFGYAQWTGDRRRAFERYVEANGLDKSSYDANYGFLKHELATDRYERQQFNKVKKATTAAEAARIVSEEYLRPGTPRLGERTRLANEALAFADTPVPPGDLNYDVGTLTDTVPPARIAPVPVTPSQDLTLMRGVMGNAMPQAASAFGPGPRVELPTASRAAAEAATSAPTKSALDAFIARSAKPSARPMPQGAGQSYAGQDRALGRAIAAPAKLTAPGAIDASVRAASTPSMAAIAAAAARSMQPGRSITERSAPIVAKSAVTGSTAKTAADTRLLRQANQANADAERSTKVVASYPTAPAQARLPTIPASTIGSAPATRTVAATRVVPRNTNIQSAQSEQAIARSASARPASPVVTTLPRMTVAAPKATPATPASRMATLYATGGPTRPAAQLPVGAMYAGIYPAKATEFTIGGNKPNVATTAPKVGVSPGQVAMIGAGVSSQVNPQGQRVTLPTQALRVAAGSPVPLASASRPSITASRATQVALAPTMPASRPASTVALPRARPDVAVATRLDVAPPRPTLQSKPVSAAIEPPKPNFINQVGNSFMANTPIGAVLSAAAPAVSNLAVGRPAFAQARPAVGSPLTQRAPRPVAPYAPMQGQHPVVGILSSIAGRAQPGTLLGALLGASGPRPAVGASLGVAGNGGSVTQGKNGALNSLTQASDAWRVATGQQSRSAGQSNDTRYESYF